MNTRSVAALSLCIGVLLSAGLSSATEPATEPDDATVKSKRSRVPSQLATAVNTREAERRLVQAQKKRGAGRAALPGEIVQTPGGAVVSRSYWHRQEKLRLEVEVAQRRLNQVQRPQVAQR